MGRSNREDRIAHDFKALHVSMSMCPNTDMRRCFMGICSWNLHGDLYMLEPC